MNDKWLFILVCAFILSLCAFLIIVSTKTNQLEKKTTEIIEEIVDIQAHSAELVKRINLLEGRPPMLIKSATIFNLDDDIVIQEDGE